MVGGEPWLSAQSNSRWRNFVTRKRRIRTKDQARDEISSRCSVQTRPISQCARKIPKSRQISTSSTSSLQQRGLKLQNSILYTKGENSSCLKPLLFFE